MVWTVIGRDSGCLTNLPDHSQGVIFKYGVSYYAGYFMSDCEDNFGFYANGIIGDDDFAEAENVTHWMPIPGDKYNGI